jgi:uncharacterized protein (TIGR02466 family)
MIENDLFKINFYKISVKNFLYKKQLTLNLLKNYPEKKIELQTFFTNRQSNRQNLDVSFANIYREELLLLSENLKKNLRIEDIWSVSYKSGDYHTPHNHGSIGITGILYLQLPKDCPTTKYIQPWNNYENDTTLYYNMPAIEGDIIVVPKFVNHFTDPNKSKKIKKIVSFDLKIL